MNKKIKQIYQAEFERIAWLDTYRAMPLVQLRHLDPFLLLNHHGPQYFEPGNSGLPFGPHPHRGFETLTFILQGDLTHKDSSTGESVIKEGGVQWMTAGKGIIHAEISSEEFHEKGGMEEIIQLWLNLPSHLKMAEPVYQGLQKHEIPHVSFDDGRGELALVSGDFLGTQGPIKSLSQLFTSRVRLLPGAKFDYELPERHQVLFYVISGKVEVNGRTAVANELVEFETEGKHLSISAEENSQLIFCHGLPFDEPIVSHGPFVMNTPQEINQAIRDYQSGKMGSLS